MNSFAKLDKSMVIDYLRSAESGDPEAVRTRYLHLDSKMKLYRKILMVPLVLGCIQMAVGAIGMIVIVGVLLLVPGIAFTAISWWARNRLRQNLIVAETAFRDFTELQSEPEAESA